ncbi:hypothetical protein P280DRAFT_199483 [Massarina eburnea CBS 473.64]|uniref:Uncharacterized protein n=1 Tax=Massarina eburnea CBS 473.64 TaxID=1395130 RepID=A0A6A6RHZ3_9PLEO|nr:hypothetical protein P280DRAFT_199483 [Massarina eburnea CBS 473.64]
MRYQHGHCPLTPPSALSLSTVLTLRCFCSARPSLKTTPSRSLLALTALPHLRRPPPVLPPSSQPPLRPRPAAYSQHYSQHYSPCIQRATLADIIPTSKLFCVVVCTSKPEHSCRVALREDAVRRSRQQTPAYLSASPEHA